MPAQEPDRGQRRQPGACRSFGRRRRFTLLEILIVLAIVTLVLALAMPRVGRLPERLRVEQGVAAVRTALEETALRARATGAELELVLHVDERGGRFTVRSPAGEDAFSPGGFVPSLANPLEPSAGEQEEEAGGLRFEARDFVLPEGVVWDSPGTGRSAIAIDAPPAYRFGPSGDASGPRLVFGIGKRRFSVEVDRLTGAPIIRERES